MKTVIVVGLARGGTSLTCGVLNALGVKMATSVPNDAQLKNNPKGMFEHNSFYAARDISKDLNQNWSNLDIVVEKHKFIFNEWKKRFGGPLWGFKSLDNHALAAVVKGLPNVHVVIVGRNWFDNARSLQVFPHFRSNNFEKAARSIARNFMVLAEWMDRNESNESLRVPKLYTTYERIRFNPVGEAMKMCKFLGIKFDDQKGMRVKDFIDPRIKTWKESGNDVVWIDPREVVKKGRPG